MDSPSFNNYDFQQRGSKEAYEAYYQGMDKTALQKIALSLAHLQLSGNIVDMGMGSGMTTQALGSRTRDIKVVGIDISDTSVKYAQDTFPGINVSYERGDVESKLFEEGSITGIFNSSTGHHLHSYSGTYYDSSHVESMIKNHTLQLKEGGIFVLRDFVKPDAGTSIIELFEEKDRDLFRKFSKSARALEKEENRGFFYEEIKNDETSILFRASTHYINEFILRKDYLKSWEVELNEEYGYFTREDFLKNFHQSGLRVNFMAPIWNPWILRNRFRGKFQLFDEVGDKKDFLPTNFLIVGQKIAPSEAIEIVEKSTIKVRSGKYFDFHFYKNALTGEVFECIQRKNEVRDIFPYSLHGDTLKIAFRYEHPRPIVNSEKRGSPNIDGKYFSGFMIEPFVVLEKISEVQEQTIAMTNTIIGCDPNKEKVGLRYYASPGMIAENIQSMYQLHENLDTLSNKTTRVLDVQDIIRIAQSGGLADARIELNAYRLMQIHHIYPDAWINETPNIAHGDIVNIQNGVSSDIYYEEVFDNIPHRFLSLYQSVFTEKIQVSHNKQENGKEYQIEFVTPKMFSNNVISLLPILLSKEDGEVYIYLEERQLPVPQIFEGNAHIITTFAYRLKKEIDSFWKLENFGREKLQLSTGVIDRLGEAYFTSNGCTPEKVYPYIVSSENMSLESGGKWVKLREVFTTIESLKDMQTILLIYRLVHALGKWEQYMRDGEV